MPYRILVTRKVPGHAESTLVEVDRVTDYWEHQILAGNAVMLDEPESPALIALRNDTSTEPAVDPVPRKTAGSPRGKGPGPRGQEKLVAPSETDEDPEG